ncbi:hypothetical protein CI610_02819 [invertebrate metagenome]|uniref:Uncharacterized protein n=1 Tax=invertebrate metagenome TaxID=1711999 RepID=A0A2H9T4X4_9ZZZZ
MKLAKYLLLFLLAPYIWALDLESDFIGTWQIEGDFPFKSYVIYHQPHTYRKPIEFNIEGYGILYSSDILYGRYDVVVELGISQRLISGSGIWFHPLDITDNYIFDLQKRDVDIRNFKFPQNIRYSSQGIALTRILDISSDTFSYEEYSPISHDFSHFKAIRTTAVPLNEILKLPYHDEL